MPEGTAERELEKLFESLAASGKVADLVTALGAYYPTLRPDPETGYVVLGREKGWLMGAKLDEVGGKIRVGHSHGFWRAEEKVNFAVEGPNGRVAAYSLPSNQEVRWQMPEEKSLMAET